MERGGRTRRRRGLLGTEDDGAHSADHYGAFSEYIFCPGTRNLRPAHQFQNAVLIFDEVQTLPVKQIALFNSLINYLTQLCGCTCVLCTATQPLLGETVKPVYPVKMAEPAALAELPRKRGSLPAGADRTPAEGGGLYPKGTGRFRLGKGGRERKCAGNPEHQRLRAGRLQ